MAAITENSKTVSRDDVLWCYQNLLGRAPESEQAIEWHCRAKDFRNLVERLVKSPEFLANRNGDANESVAHRVGPTGSDYSPEVLTRSVEAAFRMLRERFRACSLEIKPAESSSLYLCNDDGVPLNVHLPVDSVIGHFTVLNGRWDLAKPIFAKQLAENLDDDIVVVDIGANVGLFSRQCLSAMANISVLYAYEPHPLNFDLLSRNLRGLTKVRLNNFALGRTADRFDLYLDPDNAGNYSLNPHAVPQNFSRTPVAIVKAAHEETMWLAHNRPIFYKSDTQGWDELIATSLSPAFWNRVRGGVFELWRIPGKEYDADQLVRILDCFENKVFSKRPQEQVSSREVMSYLSADDYQFDDLMFWRD